MKECFFYLFFLLVYLWLGFDFGDGERWMSEEVERNTFWGVAFTVLYMAYREM